MNKMLTTMLKGKSVINIVFFMLIFLTKTYGQIEGTYCDSHLNFNLSNCIQFKENKEFNYEYSGDLGVLNYGKGNWRIANDSLVLKFTKSKPFSLNYHRLYAWNSHIKDSINLKFKIRTM